MKITKELLIKAPLDKCYRTYADIAKWIDVLDDVIDIKIFYDDSRHQEFEMTVRRGDRTETVHSIRFCNPFTTIEIFQTQPPPSFKKMTGIWRFNTVDSGTLVTAERNFEVKDDHQFDSEILANFLQINLDSFKRWIELNA